MLPPGELPVPCVLGVRDLSRELGPPAEYGRVPSEATVYSGAGVAMLVWWLLQWNGMLREFSSKNLNTRACVTTRVALRIAKAAAGMQSMLRRTATTK